MRLYVFDDRVADGWEPFALSRPCGELLYGRLLLRERLERWTGLPAAGSVSRPWLASFREAGAPPVVGPADLDAGEGRLLLCARAVPADEGADFDELLGRAPRQPLTLRVDGQVAGAWLPVGTPTPPPAWFAEPGALRGSRSADLPGELLGPVWDLVAGGPERLGADLERDAKEAGAGNGDAASGAPRPAETPAGTWRLGDGPLLLAGDVRVEPGVVFDTREGPVRLDAGVEVRTGARLAGPLWAGQRSRLLGGSIGSLAAGPFSYLRGEVEDTVVLGWTNKAHDGFLGHAYLGRWVNLGAMTTNSDLKNNYGTVRVGAPGRERDTGLTKLGCLLGDHVKTGIGVLLNTGTVIGTGSNVFGSEMPPKWVPPFAWGRGEALGLYRRDAFLSTAETVLGRREVAFDDATRAWLAAVWETGSSRREDAR